MLRCGHAHEACARMQTRLVSFMILVSMILAVLNNTSIINSDHNTSIIDSNDTSIIIAHDAHEACAHMQTCLVLFIILVSMILAVMNDTSIIDSNHNTSIIDRYHTTCIINSNHNTSIIDSNHTSIIIAHGAHEACARMQTRRVHAMACVLCGLAFLHTSMRQVRLSACIKGMCQKKKRHGVKGNLKACVEGMCQ